jgi:cyclase
MLKTRIIPILLLKGNSVVKTVRFQDARMVGDAITNVKVFSSRMADEMVIVDIEATAKGRINEGFIKRLAKQCVMPLAIGGGVIDLKGADTLFLSGADKVVINSAFYQDPDLLSAIAGKYGSQAVVFSLDVRQRDGDYAAVSHCGTVEQPLTAMDAVKRAVDCGAGEIILNSIDRDGTMAGYDLDLVAMLTEAVDVPVVAAGGCGKKEDCVAVVENGAAAVAAGSIFYWVGESIITLKQHMHDSGIEVRML